MCKVVIKSSTKIFKSGNSNAVRLSKDLMHASGLKANDTVNVTFNSQDGSIVIRPSKRPSQFHDDFAKLLKESMDDDKEALEFLKDK